MDTKAGYVLDTANYHDFIIVNAGIRYDDYHIRAANNTSSQIPDDGITSYNVGLVVKPVKIGSIYFAYATAADPVGDELDAHLQYVRRPGGDAAHHADLRTAKEPILRDRYEVGADATGTCSPAPPFSTTM